MTETRARSRSIFLSAVLVGTGVIQYLPPVREYLVTAWTIVALGGAIFLSLMLLEEWEPQRRDPLTRFHWILLTAYLVHQFEEHGVDLYGRPYFFITYVRSVISAIGAADGFSLTPLAIYRTNTLFVWLPLLVAVWGRRRFLWPGLAAGGLVLVNGILHVGLALWRGEYNPGVGSAIALFLPCGLLYFRFVRRRCDVPWQGVAGGVLFGVVLHVLLLLRIRFNLGSEMRPAVLGVVALAPLIVNVLYDRRGETTMWLRHLLAITVLPFTVTVLVPWWIARRFDVAPTLASGAGGWIVQITGAALLALGLFFFVASLRRFATEGQGTLAPWDPPRQLVMEGLYRHVRNPMISGVVLFLFGESLVLLSVPHAAWAAAFLGVNLVYIPLFEEPQLERRFGEPYREYCRHVSRLIPRLRPWTPGASRSP